MNRHAIDGDRTITQALPHFSSAAGRTIGTEEERLVLEVLRSGQLSRNGGRMVKALEERFAAMLGLPHAVACSSGTASVHLCLAALDLEPETEVIVPPVTDMGSVLPILWQNCVPVFADLDPGTLTLDPQAVEQAITPRTRAIIAVHLAGQPCDMARLRQIADRHNLALIEDCSQAYWAEVDGQRVGTLGDLACFSLQQSKHITCGEGGLMVARNRRYAERALLFSDKAWPRSGNSLGSCRFLFLSQNYRMSDLQGAVALAQLDKIAASVERRRASAQLLTDSIAGVPGVAAPSVPANTRHSYWLYMLRVRDAGSGRRTERFGETLAAEGVPAWARYIVDPLYLSPLFTEQRTYGVSGYPLRTSAWQSFERGLCPVAERVLQEVVAIHWNENYTPEQVGRIAAAIRKAAAQ
jgi:dTDP-4-amino-4,6-dideoxygalactose transaminase